MGEEAQGVPEDEVIDGCGGVTAASHFEGGVWHGEGAADAPVAGAIHPDVVEVSGFYDVDGACGAAFGLGVEGESGPEAMVEYSAVGVFFDVVNDDALGFNVGVAF